MRKKEKLSKEESVLKCILNKYNKSETNSILLYRDDISSLNLEEKEISRIVYLLQEDGLLTITKKSNRNDFSTCWTIALKSPGVRYFEVKEEQTLEKKKDNFRFWIPVIISVIALIVAA